MTNTCIIFGATGGIGSNLARRLKGQYQLVLCARSQPDLDQLAAEVGGRAAVCDAREFAQVETVFQAAKERGESVAGAVNCVGSILLKPAHLTSERDFEETIAANLKSAFAVTRAAAKAMMKAGGSVVLISSAAAEAGLANHEAIAAAKGGVSALTRSAAATYAARSIRFNAVAPGLVDTPLAARITSNPRSLEASQKMHPLGRIGKPEDVASTVAWLLQEHQSWVTGQVIGIDGGMAAVRGR